LVWLGQAAATEIPKLPIALSNNATTMLMMDAGPALFSFTGLLAGKGWQDVTSNAWWLPPNSKQWQSLPAVPGGEGRLAAVAVTANQSVWLFGGYTVAEDGSEVSTVETFKAVYQRMTDIPIPVDDAVALVYQNRYIYLISGWHDVGNVNLVQIYDTHTDQWQQATPWPGDPVFGHAGAIASNKLLVCGGVKITHSKEGDRDFVITDACWQGTISASDHRRIGWQPIEPMPGAARYRAGSANLHGDAIVFIGGSDNPYNYDGIGYNGLASQPLDNIVSFDFSNHQWRCHAKSRVASMDHRGLLLLPDQTTVRVGGMLSNQQVTAEVLQQSISTPQACQ